MSTGKLGKKKKANLHLEYHNQNQSKKEQI